MELYGLLGSETELVQNSVELVRCLKGLAITELLWHHRQVTPAFKKSLLGKLDVVIGTLNKLDLHSVLMSLGRMYVPWAALSPHSQDLLWSNLALRANELTLRQSVTMMHALGGMGFPLRKASAERHALVMAVTVRTLDTLVAEVRYQGPGRNTTGDVSTITTVFLSSFYHVAMFPPDPVDV